MLVVTGATIWMLISLAVILNAVKAPGRLIQVGLGILSLEFVLLVIASSTSECSGGPCVSGDQITEASGLSAAAVSYVTPAFTIAFTLFAIAYGLVRHRGAGT